jgi:VCBS repeat-containing protein
LTHRNVDTLSVNLNGDWRDQLGDNSVSQIRLGLNLGQVDFTDPDAEQRDSRSTNSQGDFAYLTLDLQHRQALSTNWQYSLRLSAQKSADNLDSSQKFSAAGPYAIRSYDVGSLSGDSSFLISTEFNYRWAATQLGNFSVYGFADGAKIQINQQLWQGVTGRNRISLAGVGLGVRWQGFKQWSGSTYIAVPLGSTPNELGKRKAGLLWFELSRHF